MQHLQYYVAPILIFTLSHALAQSQIPTVIQPISDINDPATNEPVVINLKEIFEIPGVEEPVAHFQTTLGSFNVELFTSEAPNTVNNFLNYVDDGDYTDTVIHFSETQTFGIIQGGTYTVLPIPFDPIPTDPPVVSEAGHPHDRGTISTTVANGNPNSATSSWHINIFDNGGFFPHNTVFGQVIGAGIGVINDISLLDVTFLSGDVIPRLPVINYLGGALTTDNFVFVRTVSRIPIYPEETRENAVLRYEIENSNPKLVTASLNGSILKLYRNPVQTGTAEFTVRAVDTDNIMAESTFRATYNSPASTPLELVLEGTGNIAGENIEHPSGNIFDQVLMIGESIKLRAKTNQITRVSFLDEDDDIVQVEFSGTGLVSVDLDPTTFSPPAPPVKYNQPTVNYVKGRPTVRVEGADESTFLSIFTVGTINAVNQALFPEGVVYDAEADVNLVEVINSTVIGGMQLSNVSFFGSEGRIGVDARKVRIATRLTVGDIDASEFAVPHLLFAPGSFTVNVPNSGMRITGGDLIQSNGLQAILVAEDDLTDPGFTTMIVQNNFKSDETPQPTQSINVDFANEEGTIISIPIVETTIE